VSGEIHPRAMGSRTSPSTPLGAPARRDGWWWRHSRSRSYVLFGLASILVLLEAGILLVGLWSLGGGEETWRRFLALLHQPAVRLLHVAAAPVFLWYGGRFLRLFPKSQPPRIELAFLPERLRRRPPLPVLLALVGAPWLVAQVVVLAALAGWLG
jgi:fumarate reductase subunit C